MQHVTRLTAGIVSGIALCVYFITIAPTVSFWDCGEFIACSYRLGVPHPPGAPFYILLGRIFTFIPFGDIGLRVNLISALATSAVILLLFLTIERLIREWRGTPQSMQDSILINGAAAIGALTFAFTDTLWFNAVESEVYALSLLLTALVYWLALLWMDTYKDYRSARFVLFIVYIFGIGTGVHLLNLLVIPSIILLILFLHPTLFKRIDLWICIPVLLLIGFTVYTVITIRSGLNPYIDQNNPETWENFLYYFNRKQYLPESQILGIFERKAPLWDYQIKHLFLRYFGWQFIGKGTTIDGSGFIIENISMRGLYGIPLFVGLIGLFYHFQKDWKRALSNLVLWTFTGLALVIYLNQEDPQPRERDYVYVGCFYAFAIWIGIGAFSIIETIRMFFRRFTFSGTSTAIIGYSLLMLFLPVNLFRFNFYEHNRSGNYTAWDTAYNLLNTCDQDAILFTNGDNDTFPLWYLQQVEYIRTDVSIVNLSLLNTHWYIKQLKEVTPPVPIRLTNEQIEQIKVMEWLTEGPQSLPVPIKLGATINRQYMRNDLQYQSIPDSTILIEYSLQPSLSIGDRNFLRIQDQMIIEIIRSNAFIRPIYFAVSTGEVNRKSVQRYLRLDGLAYKLVTHPSPQIITPILSHNLNEVYKFRGLNNPSIYRSETDKNMVMYYKNLFIKLAGAYYSHKDIQRSALTLDTMFERIPEQIFPNPDYKFSLDIGKIYYNSGQHEKLSQRLGMLSSRHDLTRAQSLEIGTLYLKFLKDPVHAEPLFLQLTHDTILDPEPFQLLLNMYEQQKRYTDQISLLERWLELNPNDVNVRRKINEIRTTRLSQDIQ